MSTDPTTPNSAATLEQACRDLREFWDAIESIEETLANGGDTYPAALLLKARRLITAACIEIDTAIVVAKSFEAIHCPSSVSEGGAS